MTIGLGPAVVLRLIPTLPPNSCIFFDRYFTTVPLIQRLSKYGIKATGTIQDNRLKGVKFSADKTLKRGDCEEFCSADGMVTFKWKDTKCVTMLSNTSGKNPIQNVKRWCKQDKQYIQVPCPSVIRRYNSKMGGVDICDQQMECYGTWIITKK